MEVGATQQRLRRWRAVQTRDKERATNEREQERRRESKRTLIERETKGEQEKIHIPATRPVLHRLDKSYPNPQKIHTKIGRGGSTGWAGFCPPLIPINFLKSNHLPDIADMIHIQGTSLLPPPLALYNTATHLITYYLTICYIETQKQKKKDNVGGIET